MFIDTFPTGCPHGLGRGEGGVSQMQTAAARGRGGQKSLKMCGHPLRMAPTVQTSTKAIVYTLVPPIRFFHGKLSAVFQEFGGFFNEFVRLEICT